MGRRRLCNTAVTIDRHRSSKEGQLSRLVKSRNSLSTLILSVLLAATPAYADVMEVHAGHHSWVTKSEKAAATPVQNLGESLPLAPVTSVNLSAGPEIWRGHVAFLATKYDISPMLLEALVWQESRWRTGAVSPVGARGLAQLMPGTARQLGVNPDDPHANLEGGARYLREQLDRFGGNVEKALAAYNAGPGRVLKAGGIPRIRETQNYVAAIMARLSEIERR